MIALNRRRVMGASGGGLPYDAEIEYLQSSGTQYINTGIKPDNTYTFDSKVAVTQSNINCVYWGVRTAGTYSTNNSQCYLNSNTNSNTIDRDKRIRLLSTASNYTTNWDSNIIPTTNTMYEFTGMTVVSTMTQMQYPVTLFALNNIGSINASLGRCRIGYWKAYSNGVLVCDMIPVRVGTTGYMFDKITHTLYGNAGTGDFILGNDKTT